MKRADLRFSRRALRKAIGWDDTQLKLHLARLVELEYLVAHRTRTGGFEYELVYELAGTAQGGLRFPGLADIGALKHAYDAARSGSGDAWSGPGRPVVGVQSAGSRGDASTASPVAMRVVDEAADMAAQTHCSMPLRAQASYTQAASLVAPEQPAQPHEHWHCGRLPMVEIAGLQPNAY